MLLYLIPLVLLIIILIENMRKNSKVRKVPAPPETLFGHLYILTANTDTFFERARRFAKEYYPIYRYSFLGTNIVHLLDPDDIKMVLTSNEHISKSSIYNLLHNWLGTGLLTSTGKKWHKRRKILTPTFHFSILCKFVDIFNKETDRLVQELEKNLGIIDVVPPVTKFTLQSVLETAMGLDKNCDSNTEENYKKAVHEIGTIVVRRLANPWYWFNITYKHCQLYKTECRVIKTLHDFSNAIIKKKEEDIGETISTKRTAMLDLLLLAKKQGADIDYDGIREEVDTFMFEGHDTTAVVLSYLLLTLANLPEIQTRIVEEIRREIGENQHPSYGNLQELKYTERCIKEALRLYPSVPLISRRAGSTFITKTGFEIPIGTTLHLHIFDLHRNPIFFSDPLTFNPDRFLPENLHKIHPFAYLPFSAGPRNCIGQKFALLELKAALCGILQKFHLEKVDSLEEIQFKPDLVLRPKTGLRIKLQLRD